MEIKYKILTVNGVEVPAHLYTLATDGYKRILLEVLLPNYLFWLILSITWPLKLMIVSEDAATGTICSSETVDFNLEGAYRHHTKGRKAGNIEFTLLANI